jgi:hypothetical protein
MLLALVLLCLCRPFLRALAQTSPFLPDPIDTSLATGISGSITFEHVDGSRTSTGSGGLQAAQPFRAAAPRAGPSRQQRWS